MRNQLSRTLVLALTLLIPAVTSAQSTITGIVTDTSGAVLPGVTVEAASDALIEKVRADVTDGSGQYRILDLRPGTYKVSFKLPGFNTFVRDALVLPADFVSTVNAEMRVGTLEETVTVTGESPIVDVQSARRQTQMNNELIEALPTAQGYAAHRHAHAVVRRLGRRQQQRAAEHRHDRLRRARRARQRRHRPDRRDRNRRRDQRRRRLRLRPARHHAGSRDDEHRRPRRRGGGRTDRQPRSAHGRQHVREPLPGLGPDRCDAGEQLLGGTASGAGCGRRPRRDISGTRA